MLETTNSLCAAGVHHQLHFRAWPAVVRKFICTNKMIRDRTFLTFDSEYPPSSSSSKPKGGNRSVHRYCLGNALADEKDVC